jgi:hypothetical protein
MSKTSSTARAFAGLLLGAAASLAAAHAPQPGAADPRAVAPATVYRPALDYRPPAAPAASPDRNWQASNDTVAATNSMALTMKPMDGPAPADPHAGHHTEPAAASPSPPAHDHHEAHR